MRSLIILGAAALVAGSPAPAPAAIDFGAVWSAAAPSLTGPLPGVVSQTGVYNAASASASAVAAATGVATASSSTSEKSKRELAERSFCILGFCIGGSSSGSSSSSSVCTTSTTAKTSTKCASTTTSAAAVKTTTSCKTTATSAAVTTSAPATTSAAVISSSVVVPSTCTPISWTNTNSFTSDSACPTPYETGTYCGFINPEDPCAPQPDGYAPLTVPDTSAAFLANPVLHKIATSAAGATGYAQTFQDLNASVSANSYMGLYTLTSYDVQGCADYCDDTDLCTGFNVFIERDPAWNPEQCSCSLPSSIANYKCTIWGSGVQAAAATNFGQTRDGGFEVVIVGSNGYEKTNTTTPTTPTGWTNPQKCSGVHDHPRTCMGEKIFKGVFDVSLCATYASAQNAKNVKSGLLSKILSILGYNPAECNFFNAFMLTQDGVASGTYCKLFAEQYKPSVATSIPGWSGGSYFGVESSWSFCSS